MGGAQKAPGVWQLPMGLLSLVQPRAELLPAETRASCPCCGQQSHQSTLCVCQPCARWQPPTTTQPPVLTRSLLGQPRSRNKRAVADVREAKGTSLSLSRGAQAERGARASHQLASSILWAPPRLRGHRATSPPAALLPGLLTPLPCQTFSLQTKGNSACVHGRRGLRCPQPLHSLRLHIN